MLKFLKSTLLWSCTLIASLNASNTYSEEQWKDVYEKAVLSSPLVAQMHEDGLKRRQQESLELEILREHVSDLYAKDTFDKAILKETIQKEFGVFQTIEARLKTYPIDKDHMTFQLYYSKMALNLQIAYELIQNISLSFWALVNADTHIPKGFELRAPAMNFCGNTTHPFASKRGNGLKVLLTTAWRLGTKSTSFKPMNDMINFDQSPFMHIVHLPDSFETKEIETFPYFWSDAQTPKGLMTIHNGYAFGGHRGEARYPNSSKPFGPQDCSSIVAKYICPVPCTTMQMAYHWQGKYGFYFKQMQGYSAPAWEQNFDKWQSTDPWSKPMAASMEPVVIEDLSKTKPGMVHLERTYTNNAFQGAGGHAGILLGILGQGPDAKALTLSANRDLEGAGFEFSYGAQERQAVPLWDTKRLVTYFEKL